MQEDFIESLRELSNLVANLTVEGCKLDLSEIDDIQNQLNEVQSLLNSLKCELEKEI